jgi:hypothetical protein
MKDATERLIPDLRWTVSGPSLPVSTPSRWQIRMITVVVGGLFMALAVFLRTQCGW